MKKKKKKNVIKILSIIAIVLVIITSAVGYFIGNYFYNLALNPSVDKSVIFDSPQNTMDSNIMGTTPMLDAWFDQTNFTEEYTQSADQLQLHALQTVNENESNKWVIICHGYTSKAEHMISSGKQFYDLGYNLLLPNARGHGKSEGHYIGMGWDERLDIVNWIEHIITNQPDAQIVLYGVSMGGATVMMTAGEPLPTNVKAIVEDCGYTSVHDIFSYQLKATFGYPSFPIMNFANIMTRFRAGYSLVEASALNQVKQANTPILFIHGQEDTFVPYQMVQELYDAAPVEKELYIVPGAGHGGAASEAGEDYWNTVETFINRFID